MSCYLLFDTYLALLLFQTLNVEDYPTLLFNLFFCEI